MNAPTKQTPRCAAELAAIRNMEWSLIEYHALAERYADAVQAMQVAVATNDFLAVRAAALTLHEVNHQTSGLNLGIRHAIQRATGVLP
jgi:hypothetical protein